MNTQVLRLEESLGINRSEKHERPFLVNELKLNPNRADKNPFPEMNEMQVKTTVKPNDDKIAKIDNQVIVQPNPQEKQEEDYFQYSHNYLRLEKLIEGYFDRYEKRKINETLQKTQQIAKGGKLGSQLAKSIAPVVKNDEMKTKIQKNKICKFVSQDMHISRFLNRNGFMLMSDAPLATGFHILNLKYVTKASDDYFSNILDDQWINHFQNNKELTSKSFLAKNMLNIQLYDSPQEEHTDLTHSINQPSNLQS